MNLRNKEENFRWKLQTPLRPQSRNLELAEQNTLPPLNSELKFQTPFKPRKSSLWKARPQFNKLAKHRTSSKTKLKKKQFANRILSRKKLINASSQSSKASNIPSKVS